MDTERTSSPDPSPVASPSEKVADKPAVVTAVYRGPSGVLQVEGHELRLHELHEVSEEVFRHIQQQLPGHVLERVEN